MIPTEYKNIIYNIVRKHHKVYREDLTQECIIEYILLREKKSRDENHFKAKLIKRCAGRCIDYLRTERGNNRINAEGECALDSISDLTDTPDEARVNNLDSGYDLDSQLDVQSHIEHITPNHSIREMRVLELTMQGYTARDIEECFPELEVKERTVYRILKRFEDDSI